MCELLGMSANVPTDICFSFAGLMHRGGDTGPHADGWGIAFYEDKGCRAFLDPGASADSPIAKLLRDYSIKSLVTVCHIRRANRGRVTLQNTHPFIRELWGHNWCFAHNGQLQGIKKRPLEVYRPVGTTDSEYAFCWMLDQLRARWPKMPSPAALRAAVEELAQDVATCGVFNMLLADGRSLYCFRSTDLCWITRRAPFGPATLIDEDLTVDFSRETTPDDIVTVVATRPMTRDETWYEMPRGMLAVFRDGLLLMNRRKPLSLPPIPPCGERPHADTPAARRRQRSA